MPPLSRRFRPVAAAAVTGALLVPATLLGGARAAVAVAQYAYGGSGAQYQYGGSGSQYQYRVQVCHRTGSRKHPFHTITVSSRAARAHLRHGDHLGSCTGAETLTRRHHHGKDHGQKGRDETGTSGHDSWASHGHSSEHGSHGSKHD